MCFKRRFEEREGFGWPHFMRECSRQMVQHKKRTAQAIFLRTEGRQRTDISDNKRNCQTESFHSLFSQNSTEALFLFHAQSWNVFLRSVLSRSLSCCWLILLCRLVVHLFSKLQIGWHCTSFFSCLFCRSFFNFVYNIRFYSIYLKINTVQCSK